MNGGRYGSLMQKTPPKTVDAYMARVPEPMRAALEKIRAAVRAAAPDAVEEISYQMPGIRQDGRGVVTYAAFKKHMSFFPMSHVVVAAHADALAPFLTSPGTVQFTVEKPLPATLVKKIVKARLAENAALNAKKKTPAKKKAVVKKAVATKTARKKA